ncbi:MAG: GGDEF domain-containing protein [Actinobacteria bacterium]|nr:GGDEF domain-containing protein [Actinomycetota bacterium]
MAETVRDGETWILLAAFAGLFATASLNTVARTFLLRREDSGERSISPRVSRSAVIDLVECALATPIVAIVAFVSIASSTLAATGLASVVLALGLASRARASSVTALASERAAARRDQLTGAPNRRAFEEALAIEHARVARGGAPAGVFVVDIDRFKSVNDRFGHHVGDEVLVGVVERIKSGLRSPDLLARWGGEEIVILAPGIKTIDGLTAFGERVRRLVGDVPLATKTTAIPITVSVGGTLMDGRSSPQAALKAADGALYDAKRTRDTCVVARPPRSALRLDERSHRTAS